MIERKELQEVISNVRKSIIDNYEQRSSQVQQIDMAVDGLTEFFQNPDIDPKIINNFFVFMSKLDESLKNPNVQISDHCYHIRSGRVSSDMDD